MLGGGRQYYQGNFQYMSISKSGSWQIQMEGSGILNHPLSKNAAAPGTGITVGKGQAAILPCPPMQPLLKVQPTFALGLLCPGMVKTEI